MKFNGIIFDLDGTLVTSTLDFQLIRAQINCPPEEDILHFLESLAPEEKAKATKIIYDHEINDAHSATKLPGTDALLSGLMEKSIPTAIVTRNQDIATGIKLSRNDIKIDTVLTRDDAPAKPDPTALLDIAKQWQHCPTTLVYVGDYLYDIQAARNANMHACLITTNGDTDYQTLADIVIDDLTELLDYV